jgi:ketosteroid isomerase-like protein
MPGAPESSTFERRARWLRSAWEAFHERHDYAAFFDAYDPEAELYVSPSAVEPGTYRGAEAVKSFWLSVLAAWPRYENHTRELIDLGDDRVPVVCDAPAWNPQSAVPLDKELALVFEFDGDRIIRSEYYFDGKAEALEAVGLRE